jgi:hypothetical protein
MILSTNHAIEHRLTVFSLVHCFFFLLTSPRRYTRVKWVSGSETTTVRHKSKTNNNGLPQDPGSQICRMAIKC